MTSVPPSEPGELPRARVWIVDDSPLQAELEGRALARRHDVRVFTDGMSLLEALGSGAPDLLIIDWHMPNMSGLELCRFVRDTRDPGALPILILTATGGDDLTEAFAAGANDFMRKPFSQTELDARVGALVRNQQIHAKLAATERQLRIEGEFRERFIAMLAHDLRQPLSTFILAQRTIVSTVSAAASKELERLFELQVRSAGRMTRMIAELLDFTRSRPETGMPVDRQVMDFEPVARAVIEEMRGAYPARTFRLHVEGACTGYWDRDRLAQVCTNLIGNAVEHSSAPSSPIDVDLVRHGERVEFAVSNAGTPIPSSLLPDLFRAFRHGHTGRRSEGLGLGLHIVHEIVRAHGGHVSAESDAKTTVFRVELPVDPPAPLPSR